MEVIVRMDGGIGQTGTLLVVTDMDKTVDFYKKVLGLHVIMDFGANKTLTGGLGLIEYVHPVKEHGWGQRVVRFYDPDKHIIEVGENMKVVSGCMR